MLFFVIAICRDIHVKSYIEIDLLKSILHVS